MRWDEEGGINWGGIEEGLGREGLGRESRVKTIDGIKLIDLTELDLIGWLVGGLDFFFFCEK